MKKKILACSLLLALVTFALAPAPVLAANTAKHGDMTGRTFVHGLASLIIWPGLGQYLNHNETKKNVTHGVCGLFPPFRLWSGWDALINRQGGRWDGKI